MNDEPEIPEPPRTPLSAMFWQSVTALGPLAVGVAMVVAIVLGCLNTYIQPRFCAPPTEPVGPHCADATGNATCVEYYGAKRPYCKGSVIVFHGCVEKPPAVDAAPCGALAEGLPNDPTCSKALADYAPPPDRPICKAMAVLGRPPILVVILIIVGGVVFLIGGEFIARVIFRERAKYDRREQLAAGPKQPSPSLPPPRASDSPPETSDDAAPQSNSSAQARE